MDSRELLINDEDEVKTRNGEIARAAWQLEDAIDNQLADAYPSYPTSQQARKKRFDLIRAERWSVRAMQGLVLLSIFETPTWCDIKSSRWNFDMTSEQRCNYMGKPNKDKLFLSNVTYLPPGISAVLEILCFLIMSYVFWLKRQLQLEYFEGLPYELEIKEGEEEEEAGCCEAEQELDDIRTDHHGKKWAKVFGVQYKCCDKQMANFGLIMVFLGIVDCTVFLISPCRIRLTFLTRTGILCTMPSVKEIMKCVAAVLTQFLSGLSFFLGFIGFFAWISVTIFGAFDESDKNIHDVSINKGLDTMSATLNTMFIAGATDEFVDCFNPSYSKYRITGVLWFFFLVIVQVLLLNLMLDTLVKAYLDHSEELADKNLSKQVQGIRKAFELLWSATGQPTEPVEDSDDEGDCKKSKQILEKGPFLDFIDEYSKSPGTREITPKTAELMFSAIDKDESKAIDVEEFAVLCGVMNYEFWVTEVNSPVADIFPCVWNMSIFQKLREWVKNGDDAQGISSTFDTFMYWVLISNLGLVLMESYQNMQNGGNESEWLEQMELIFSFIYVMEVGVKLCVVSFDEYWSDRSNQFDFFTTWLLLGSSFLDEMSQQDNSLHLKRYANILRLLRLLRVLKQLKRLERVQFMVKTTMQLVTASKDIMTSLLVVVFFFTILSVQLWGGLLHKYNEKIAESEYAESHYYVLNYNDFLTAFGAWVISLMCEYVPKFTDAVTESTGRTIDGAVFLMFYFFSVSIIFELVKAFTIEVFLDLKSHHDKAKRKQRQKLEKIEMAARRALYEEKSEHGHGHEHGHEHESESSDSEEEGTGSALKKGLLRVSNQYRESGQRLHYRAINDELAVERLAEVFDKVSKENAEHAKEQAEELKAEKELEAR